MHLDPWAMPRSTMHDITWIYVSLCIQGLGPWGFGHGHGRILEPLALKEYSIHQRLMIFPRPTTPGLFKWYIGILLNTLVPLGSHVHYVCVSWR